MKEEIEACIFFLSQLSVGWVSLVTLQWQWREDKNNSFLGLEAEHLIFDR